MSDKKLTVAVLMGGTSSEHDVSLASGLAVLRAVEELGHRAIPCPITTDGRWQPDVRPEAPDLGRPPTGRTSQPTGGWPAHAAAGLTALRDAGTDVVVLALHGAHGEDGLVQSLLRLEGLPFTGSDVLASALAMDKVQAKALYRSSGLPVARDAVVTREQLESDPELPARLADELGLPCVVKPVIGGSSVATLLVREASEVDAALKAALAEDRRALVEEAVLGRELTCAVLGGGREPSQALPPTEIRAHDGQWFDFEAKYTPGGCEEITPAPIDAELTERVQQLAVQAHELLGCEGVSRTDFMLGGPDGDRLIVLETNTIPGMTATSLLPQGAEAAGLSFSQLVQRLIDSALLRAGRS
ncbi:MAG: D-alanine--D-alanine ligase [Acidobacteriota bacterium]